MRKLCIQIDKDFSTVAKRVADAWHRAEQGDKIHEDHITFADWDILAKVMTNKRYELLRHVHSHPAVNVASLARELHLDYTYI